MILVSFDGAFSLPASIFFAEWQSVSYIRGAKFTKRWLTRKRLVDMFLDQPKFANLNPCGSLISDFSDQSERNRVLNHLSVCRSQSLVTPEPSHAVCSHTLTKPAFCLVNPWIFSSGAQGLL